MMFFVSCTYYRSGAAMNLTEKLYNHYQKLIDTTAPALMYEALRKEALKHLPETLHEQAVARADEAIKEVMNMIAQDCQGMQCQINDMIANSGQFAGATASQRLTQNYLNTPARTIA